MAINWLIVQSNVSSGVIGGLGAAGIVLNSNAATSTPLTINAHADQTASLININGSYVVGGPMTVTQMTASAADIDHTSIRTFANGFSGIHSQHITYTTGSTCANCWAVVKQISINDEESTGGEIDGLFIETTNAGSNVTEHAIHIGGGFDAALSVTGSISENPGYGYEVTAGVVADRVEGVGVGGNDAFINKAVNVQIFDNDNDYILIGANTTFEVLTCVVAVGSSKDILPTFEYSNGAGTWYTLVVDDATNGFKRSGNIDWSAPVDWIEVSQAEAPGDIKEAYYIKITRTVGGVIPTLPTERNFTINAERGGDTGMEITGHGVIKLPYLTGAPARLENGMMWAEVDGLHIYYNNLEKVVAVV